MEMVQQMELGEARGSGLGARGGAADGAMGRGKDGEAPLPRLDVEAQFLVWKQSRGAREIMRLFYRMAAGYYRRFLRRGAGVSQRLIFEQLRDAIRVGQLKGADWDGYALNNNFTKLLVKHVLQEHPEWAVLFELRESSADGAKRKSDG